MGNFIDEGGQVVFGLACQAPRWVSTKANKAAVAKLPCVSCEKPAARLDYRVFTLENVLFPVHKNCHIRCVRCKEVMAKPTFSVIFLISWDETTVWVPRHQDCQIFIARHAENLTHDQEAIHLKDYLSVEEKGTPASSH